MIIMASMLAQWWQTAKTRLTDAFVRDVDDPQHRARLVVVVARNSPIALDPSDRTDDDVIVDDDAEPVAAEPLRAADPNSVLPTPALPPNQILYPSLQRSASFEIIKPAVPQPLLQQAPNFDVQWRETNEWEGYVMWLNEKSRITCINASIGFCLVFVLFIMTLRFSYTVYSTM